eukprot:TRINITY_DN786_c0_g1_i4.p1 TRINITY_DN786_c0_g1~~TRINITY_DN786_c0_g1_i4.p1  ORF type:complete len:1003 (+),score=225.94 TRINITY_DN786_c0_g1_i4:46-3054(+)
MQKSEDEYLRVGVSMEQKEEARDLMRMSLSSTASASISDVGDLSNLWQRSSNTADIDAAIAKEVEEKYAMGRFMAFVDEKLEAEFMESYFYGAVETHRVFSLIVTGILVLHVIVFAIEKLWKTAIYHGIAGVATFFTFSIIRTKFFRKIQLPYILCLIIFCLVMVGIGRGYADFDKDESFMLYVTGARYLNMVYLFGHYVCLISLRLPFKYGIFLDLAVDVAFFSIIRSFPNVGPMDYVENLVYLAIASIPVAVSSYHMELVNRRQEISRAGILRHTEELSKEKIISERLLLNILPHKIARRLMDKEEDISDGYAEATVLFADIVGWTDIASSMSPTEAVKLLGEIVGSFDRLTHTFRVEKIKTIGDGYLVASGLPESLSAVQSAKTMALFAINMLRMIEGISATKGVKLQLTVGIHTGPVVAGVIGKTRFLYDLWGDSVNLASRMQSHGEPGKIHVTSRFRDILCEYFEFEKNPEMEVKGKGIMQTYNLVKRNEHAMLENLSDIDGPMDIGVDTHAATDQQQPTTTTDDRKEGDEEDKEAEQQDKQKPLWRRKTLGEDRKIRKAREAIQKRNKELDVLLDSKIVLQHKLIFRFTDPALEKQFEALEESESAKYILQVTLLNILISFMVGPAVLRFDDSLDVLITYYTWMGGCAIVQLVLVVIAKLHPTYGFLMNIYSNVCQRFALIAIFTVYRSQLSLGVRFIYQIVQLFDILIFTTSRIPYRFSIMITEGTFVVLLAVSLLRGQMIDHEAQLFYACLVLMGLITALQVERHNRRDFLLSCFADEEREKVMRQREESERLLFNILPESVVEKNRSGDGKLIDTYDNVTVLFADIVGFTVLSSKLDAKSVVGMLNSLFSQFDTVAENKSMEKIKTIGDAYMVVCGLPYARHDHAKTAVEMGIEMVEIVKNLPAVEGIKVNVRIGIHSGAVVGGVIGVRKMVFDIWGENVNVASKMESNGTPGCVNVSHVTRALVGDEPGIAFEDRQKEYGYCGKKYRMFYAS